MGRILSQYSISSPESVKSNQVGVTTPESGTEKQHVMEPNMEKSYERFEEDEDGQRDQLSRVPSIDCKLSTKSEIWKPSTIKLSLILLCLSVSTFLVALDRTIITAAIPRVTDEFHSLSDTNWYAAAYLLTSTAFGPTWGKIFQIFVVKYVFMLVMGLFVLGSLVCAVAPESKTFIAGRAIAGLGAAGIFTGVLTLVGYTLPLHRRPAFTSVLSVLFGIASFVGPIVGGIFTDKLSWRWCFYINIPLGTLATLGVMLCLRIPQQSVAKMTIKARFDQLDYVGPIFFFPACISLLLALQWAGSRFQWNSPVIVCLLVAFGVFTPVWVYTQVRLGEKATIPMRLLMQKTIFFTSIFAFFSSAAYIILIFYLPLYFQGVRSRSATNSAISTLPTLLSVTFASIVAGILVTKLGYYTPFMLAGSGLLAVGAGLMSTLMATTPVGNWIGYQIISGVGTGVYLQRMPILAVQTISSIQDLPVANAIFLLFQQLGPAIFVTVAQTIFLNKFLSQIRNIRPDITPADIIHTGATEIGTLVSETDLPTLLAGYARSLDNVFVLAASSAAVAAIIALGIEWKSLKKEKKPECMEKSSDT